MDDFTIKLQRAKDAWSMLSWMVYPDNERGRATPDALEKLADALDLRGVEDGAETWPNALRYIARRWQAALDAKLHELHRCPVCFSRDIRVNAEITCALVEREQDGKRHDVVQPIEDPDPYWDDDSFVVCQSCEFEGRVRDFTQVISVADLKRMEAISDARDIKRRYRRLLAAATFPARRLGRQPARLNCRMDPSKRGRFA